MSDTFVVVGFAFCGVIGLVLMAAWWSADSDVRRLHERLCDLEDAWDANFAGPQPMAITDEPATDRIPVVEPDTAWHPPIDLAAGKRARPFPAGGGEQVARPERGAHRRRRGA